MPSIHDVGVKPPVGPEYLGDAVYASFDGYHIQLHVGDHRNPSSVALDPSVMQALFNYYKRVTG